MDFTGFTDGAIKILKLPFVALIKLILHVLNIIPLPKVAIKGERKLHLGFFLVAFPRGLIFKKELTY